MRPSLSDLFADLTAVLVVIASTAVVIHLLRGP